MYEFSDSSEDEQSKKRNGVRDRIYSKSTQTGHCLLHDEQKNAFGKGHCCKITLILFSALQVIISHWAGSGMCRTRHNTEPVIAGIKIYICVTIKNGVCCPSCLTTGIKNYKYLHPCPTPTWKLRGPSPKGGAGQHGVCAQGDPLEQGVQDVRKRRQLRLEGRCPTFWGPSIRSKEQKQNFGPKFAGKLKPESLRALVL